MQPDQMIDQLREQYDSDREYFELLSSWYTSGKFKRRTDPIMQKLRTYLRADVVALDAGCAAGTMTIELARAGVQRIDAVDFSSVALEITRENIARYAVGDRVRLIEAKLEDLSMVPDNTYDIIVAADVIEHIVVPSVFIREMWRVCKPGGVMLVETPNTLFRQHPWYTSIDSWCRRLKLPASRNLFEGSSKHDWGNYHVSLLKWTDLVRLMRDERWEIVREDDFGWWIQYGAADTIMHWLGKLDRPFGTRFRYYGSADVLIIARKPE